ncbi:MAG: hypothetical protein IKS07_06200 [Lachnospiraceae bacterium]|nr:hypothetical protein [Lachnospiraceae bacterium]
MTEEHQKLLARINAYAETAMSDIEDPQKVPVSIQLERLRPIMSEIAAEQNTSLEEVFILYMDLASEASCAADTKMRDALQDLNEGEDDLPPLLYR